MIARLCQGNQLQAAEVSHVGLENHDGKRVLVTDQLEFRVLVWNAADFTFLGAFPIPSSSFGACSDGVNFWLALRDTSQLARF